MPFAKKDYYYIDYTAMFKEYERKHTREGGKNRIEWFRKSGSASSGNRKSGILYLKNQKSFKNFPYQVNRCRDNAICPFQIYTINFIF